VGDERLDDLNHRVDEGFKEMRAEFRAVRLESRTEFATVRGEIAALHRTLLQLFGGMMATFVVGFTAILIKL
jgi:hypothetical protein